MKSTFYLLLFTLAFHSCTTNNSVISELHSLVDQEKSLMCELKHMKDSIANEWDQVSNMLNEQLPEDMPAEEKNNMLKVRNANLIRMFESYKEMDEDIKTMLSETEMKDQKMGEKIIEIRKDLMQLEQKRMALLEKVDEELGEKSLSEFQDFREKKINENCII